MISENVIVERYALALFINMKKLGQIDKVFGEINYFFAQIQVNKSVEKLLLNKCAPKKTKMVFCNTLLGKMKISDLSRSFIVVLIEKKRLYLLKKIITSLEKIIDKKNNIQTLKLILAKQQDDGYLDKVKNELTKYFHSMSIKFNINYDNEILGGVIIKKDSLMLDLSFRSRIKEIKFLTNRRKFKINELGII
ncbi:ATP synthase F1 subunit delta [Candidatus Bandiella numerosa]|uniref:ATP synthase F1 subunit delta n=1 Tax=Candidatus Bandiella numerosa TaxID=2570586 RepID=UPI00249E13EB|nr:ATP synthase F1 subunit delta [Candidatus Bandiella numerosa]WHA05343.1 ATP synthase F1 subunit delta [Candidatus Bandiella numerosa]